MKSLFGLLVITVSLLFVMGCEEDPVDVHDELIAELIISPDHVHTLSDITYTVTITDHDGNFVTDLATVEVQRKAHGSDTWRGTELTLDGSLYKGTYNFYSSGEYDLRVAVMREATSTEFEVIHEMTEHFAVGRAHSEMNGLRIEYEHFPGHVHAGEIATVKFWVVEAEKDLNGNRPPVPGLATIITCVNVDASEEIHENDVQELESGVYQIDHTYNHAGNVTQKIEFTKDNVVSNAEFTFDVVQGH